MSQVDDIGALKRIVSVSRETAKALTAYVELIRKWQPAENLISPKTLPEIWGRHVADSAQLVPMFPATRRWLDFGTGAGFPGLVIAILGGPGTHVDLVESNTRKCAFLRAAIRETGAPATVHEGRVEAVLAGWAHPSGWSPEIDRITARAVAPLGRLLESAEPLMSLMTKGVPAAFLKGEDYQTEVREASQSWTFDLLERPSRVGEGVILDISALRRKPRQAKSTVPGP